MGVLRHARRDRPEPGGFSIGRVGPQDAADVLIAVEHVVIICTLRILAAGTRMESLGGSAALACDVSTTPV